MKKVTLFAAALAAGSVFAADLGVTPVVALDAAVGGTESPWAFKASAGYDVRSGNTESDAYNGHFEAVKDSEGSNFRFDIDGGYAEQTTTNDDGTEKDDQTVGNVKAAANYKCLWGNNFLAIDLTAFHDAIADVDYRFTEGLGVGRYLWKGDEFSFSVQTGIAYVQEKLGEEENDYPAWRFAERADWKPAFAEGVSFYETAEVLWNLDETDQYLLNSEAGIDIPMFSSLSVVFKVVYNYNSEPAADKESGDFQFLTQLAYSF